LLQLDGEVIQQYEKL